MLWSRWRNWKGKNEFILQILDFHFEDERKKVPVFPMQPAIDNMFDEMLKWPGKYRSYFALAQPLWAAKAVPLRLSASEQERNLENDVLRKRLDAGLCINRHKWSNKSVPSTQTMVWEGPKKGSRHNPPLPECRATPRKWLADATLLCQSINVLTSELCVGHPNQYSIFLGVVRIHPSFSVDSYLVSALDGDG